jgi:hypothetical protein
MSNRLSLFLPSRRLSSSFKQSRRVMSFEYRLRRRLHNFLKAEISDYTLEVKP